MMGKAVDLAEQAFERSRQAVNIGTIKSIYRNILVHKVNIDEFKMEEVTRGDVTHRRYTIYMKALDALFETKVLTG